MSEPFGGTNLAAKTLADAISAYGVSVKPKLNNIAIGGAPEDQLRGPRLAGTRGLRGQVGRIARADPKDRA